MEYLLEMLYTMLQGEAGVFEIKTLTSHSKVTENRHRTLPSWQTNYQPPQHNTPPLPRSAQVSTRK